MLFPPSLPPLKTQERSTQELIRQIHNFIHEELEISLENTNFLLAVSGGADSLALLCIWQWFSDKYSCSFSVLHLNHGLRPESVQEAQYLHELCKAWHIPYYMEERNIPQLAKQFNMGFEEMARKVRYEIYEEYRIKTQAAWTCLGHHLHDVQEDLLMRLIRGTSWPALAGMVAKDTNRHILRPLLMQEPQHLQMLLHQVNLSYAKDNTNDDINYFRNRVRHTISPLLQAENPSFSNKIQDLWHMAQYDAAHWQETLQALCKTHHIHCQENRVLLPATLLKKIDKSTRLRLYMHAIQMLKAQNPHAQGQARARTLFALDHSLTQGHGNTLFQLPGKICAYLKKKSIIIFLGEK